MKRLSVIVCLSLSFAIAGSPAAAQQSPVVLVQPNTSDLVDPETAAWRAHVDQQRTERQTSNFIKVGLLSAVVAVVTASIVISGRNNREPNRCCVFDGMINR